MEETQRQIKLDPKYGIRIPTQAQLISKPQFIEQLAQYLVNINVIER